MKTLLPLSDTTRVIHFCGHRLHVHPKFRLFLTTSTATISPSPSTSLPPSLTSDLSYINLGPSVPLTQDILLHTAFQVLLPKESARFGEVCVEVAGLKAKLCQLEEEVFNCLPKEGRERNYWQSTESIVELVSQKDKVVIVYAINVIIRERVT